MSHLKSYIEQLITDISLERQNVLWPLVEYIKSKRSKGEMTLLNFICTHNSRRSQLGQVWMQAIGSLYGLDLACYSGGVEITSCAHQTIKILRDSYFNITQLNFDINPKYRVHNDVLDITLFSKLFDDKVNPKENFAAIMTCDHAEANCPYVPGCEFRMAITYADPKLYDGTPNELEEYKLRSDQIASEMKWVIGKIL